MYIRKSSLKHVVDSYSCLFYSQSRWQGFFFISQSLSHLLIKMFALKGNLHWLNLFFIVAVACMVVPRSWC